MYNRLYSDNADLMTWPSGLKEMYEKATERREEVQKRCKPRPGELIRAEKAVTMQGVETLAVPSRKSLVVQYSHNLTTPQTRMHSPKMIRNIDYMNMPTLSDVQTASRNVDQYHEEMKNLPMPSTVEIQREVNVFAEGKPPTSQPVFTQPTADPEDEAMLAKATLSSNKSNTKVALSKHLKMPKEKHLGSEQTTPDAPKDSGKPSPMMHIGIESASGLVEPASASPKAT